MIDHFVIDDSPHSTNRSAGIYRAGKPPFFRSKLFWRRCPAQFHHVVVRWVWLYLKEFTLQLRQFIFAHLQIKRQNIKIELLDNGSTGKKPQGLFRKPIHLWKIQFKLKQTWKQKQSKYICGRWKLFPIQQM